MRAILTAAALLILAACGAPDRQTGTGSSATKAETGADANFKSGGIAGDSGIQGSM